jgi:hypothetical protein
MNLNPATKKPILSSDVVRSLDTMHRAVAEVMAERGLIEITDAPERIT